MPTEILTPNDLKEFKNELLNELKKIINEKQTQPAKKWLRSSEVRKLLGISPGTLQNMRSNGTLPFTKLGGVMFYDIENIKRMLDKNMVAVPEAFNHS